MVLKNHIFIELLPHNIKLCINQLILVLLRINLFLHLVHLIILFIIYTVMNLWIYRVV